MGVETLSRTLNEYFGPIVTLIESHNGDVIKFAGDALMVLFANNPFADEDTEPAASLSASAASSPSRQSLSDLVCRAVACADAVHKQFNEFSPCEGIVLKLHSAVSAGLMYACVVGGAYDRYEFLLQGQLILDLAPALREAKVGEIILTDSAYQLVHDKIVASEVKATSHDGLCKSSLHPFAAARRPSMDVPPMTRPKVLRRTLSEASPPDLSAINMISRAIVSATAGPILMHAPPTTTVTTQASVWKFSHALIHLPKYEPIEAAIPLDQPMPQRNASLGDFSSSSFSNTTRKTSLSQSRDSDAFCSTPRLSPIPASSCVSPSRPSSSSTANAAAAFLIPSVLARVQDGQGQYLAEFRRVTTLFIGLPTLPTHSPDFAVHTQALHELSNIVCTIMNIIFASRGEIRQLITDDKGTVLIAVFGLLSHSLNPLRGLKAAVDIVEKLRLRHHTVHIGITTGKVFGGTIGTLHRCEFTFIGDRINTAARLMVASSLQSGSGIISDEETLKTVSLHTTSIEAIMAENALEKAAEQAHIKHGLQFLRKSPLTLKGKSKPFPVWSVALAAKLFHPSNRTRTRIGGTLEELAKNDKDDADHLQAHAPPAIIRFKRSTLLCDLTLHRLSPPTEGQLSSAAHPDVPRDPFDIVGRTIEWKLLYPRFVQACLANGADCRRKKRKEAASLERIEAETQQATSSKMAYRKASNPNSIPFSLDSVKPPVEPPPFCPPVPFVRHGIIFIESVAGFGKSALLASMVERCTRVGPNGISSPTHPWLTLHLEPIIATADEFSQNIPYFTARTMIRCMLASFYKIATKIRRLKAKEERAQEREERFHKQMAERQMSSTTLQPPGLTSSPDIDFESDPMDDEEDEEEGIDHINVDTYSFHDIDLLGLPDSLPCRQHLHLLNEIVPGLKLPVLPPTRSVRKFHRLRSMSKIDGKDIDGYDEDVENDDEEDDEDEDDDDDDDEDEVDVNDDLNDNDNNADGISTIPPQSPPPLDALASSPAPYLLGPASASPVAVKSPMSIDDGSSIMDDQDGNSTSDTAILSENASSEDDTDSTTSEEDHHNSVLKQRLRSFHPHVRSTQSTVFNTIAPPPTSSVSSSKRNPSSLHRKSMSLSMAALRLMDGSPIRPSVKKSVTLPPTPSTPALVTPKRPRAHQRSRASVKFARPFLERGEIEPPSFSVFVSSPKNKKKIDINIQPSSTSSSSNVTTNPVLVTPINIPSSSGDPVSPMKRAPSPSPPIMSAAAKSEAIEATIIELLCTLLDMIHANDFVSLLSPTPRRSNIALFVDNVQWMDASTLTLIQSIERVLPSILIVMAGRNFTRNLNFTSRSSESGRSTPILPDSTSGHSHESVHRSGLSSLMLSSSSFSSSSSSRALVDAIVGSQLIRSAQQWGSVYIIRGEDLQRQVEERWMAEARRQYDQAHASDNVSTHTLPIFELPSSPVPLASSVPLTDPMVWNLDYFDQLPSNLSASFLLDPSTRFHLHSPIANHSRLASHQRSKSKAIKRHKQEETIRPLESVEDDPARDFNK